MEDNKRFKITATNEPLLNKKDFQKFVSREMPERKDVHSVIYIPKDIDRNNEFFIERLSTIPMINGGNIEFANCTGKPGYGIAVEIRDEIWSKGHVDSEGRLFHCIKIELKTNFAPSLPATLSTGTQTSMRDSKKREFFKTTQPFGKGLAVFLAEKKQARILREKKKK